MNEQYERVAIVTGATSGIGEATARLFVASGFGVVGIGRNAEKLAEQERELGQAFVGVAGDASDESMIGCLFAIAIERLGQEADIVVANAGRGLGGSVKDADLSEFREVLNQRSGGSPAVAASCAQDGCPAGGTFSSKGGRYRRVWLDGRVPHFTLQCGLRINEIRGSLSGRRASPVNRAERRAGIDGCSGHRG